jgi:hypothetical protein
MLAIAEPRARPKPSISIVPNANGTDLFFASFPSTSCWATFVRFLQDRFSTSTFNASLSRQTNSSKRMRREIYLSGSAVDFCPNALLRETRVELILRIASGPGKSSSGKSFFYAHRSVKLMR